MPRAAHHRPRPRWCDHAVGYCAVLQPRQAEVLAWVAQGYSNQWIARHLIISVTTVNTHVQAVYDALGVAGDPDRHPRILAALWWRQHFGGTTCQK